MRANWFHIHLMLVALGCALLACSSKSSTTMNPATGDSGGTAAGAMAERQRQPAAAPARPSEHERPDCRGTRRERWAAATAGMHAEQPARVARVGRWSGAGTTAAPAGAGGTSGGNADACTRDSLKAAIDGFYKALAAHDASTLALGASVKFTRTARR